VENQALGVDAALIFTPLLTAPFDVGAILLLCGCGFFYN
jgi:hypothetical protein